MPLSPTTFLSFLVKTRKKTFVRSNFTFDTFTFECKFYICRNSRKLAKMPNERARLGLHFKPYKTSQLALTVEKNVFEVGLRKKKEKFSFIQIAVTFLFVA